MAATWRELLGGGNGGRAAVVACGTMIHAVNVFIVTTILPSVVREIGGLDFFAWSTTLYVVASLLGGSNAARLLRHVGARNAYRWALAVFALGCAICALAPSMGVLLAGRFVQGLGAGTLSALSFAMIRTLFAAPLWPRAIAIVSLAWGVATLTGPAIGGVFAEWNAWRLAFWCLMGLAPTLWVMVEITLPRPMPKPTGGAMPVAFISLVLLAGSALAISAGSMASAPWLNLTGLAIALAGLAAFAIRERAEAAGGARVLPRGACNPRTPLGATYGAMVLMLIGVNTEIFVPYFLQTLHGQTPLHAGYLSALMAGGWSVGSMTGSGDTRAARPLRLGPVIMSASLIVLFVLMPRPGGPLVTATIAAALAAMGLGIGMCWPHLGASVFANAPEGERDLASASITTVVMVGNAMGSALGGMVTNMAGLDTPGVAAAWLFGLFALSPLTALAAVRRVG